LRRPIKLSKKSPGREFSTGLILAKKHYVGYNPTSKLLTKIEDPIPPILIISGKEIQADV
jgi:hypothetical protein